MENIKKLYFAILIIVLCLGLGSCNLKDDSEVKEEPGIIYREYNYEDWLLKFKKAKVIDEYTDVLELVETNEKKPELGLQYWKFKIKKAGTAQILWEMFETSFWVSCWIEEITINEDLSYSSEKKLLKLPENSKEIDLNVEDDIYEDFIFEYEE